MAKFQEVRIPIVASDLASPVFQKVGREADAMKRRIEAANKATALKNDWLSSGSQVKQTRRYSRTTASASSAAKEADALSSSASGLSRVLSSSRAITAAWGAAIFLAGKEALEAAVMVDRLNKAYTTIEGSSVGARVQLDYMYRTTQELGLQFYRTAEASKNFFASMKGTSIESEANKIWTGVAKAATALSLSETDVERVFRALGQMVSKGKVQAEEIRGQLGEVLPGAFTLAAKAMKITTAELDKMLERGEVLAEELLPKMAVELEKTYGEAAQQAANGLQQNLNRVSTEWETFKASVLNSENVARTLRRIADGMKAINDEKTRNERKRLAEPEMRKAGIAPEGLEWAPTGEYSLPVYTDAQYDAWFAQQEKAAEAQKKTADAAKQTEETLARASGIINAYIVNTYDVQRRLIEDRYTAVKKALDDKIVEYKKAGADISDLLKMGQLIETVHAQDLTALETRFQRKNTDYTGPYTVDAAQKALDEIRKKQAAQEAKDYRQETRDLDMVADVMQELAEKTGQYGLAVGAVNDLIDRQGELWLKAGVPQEYVDQLKEIRQLEASREGWAGAMLATQEYYSEATNMAEAYKGVVSNAFGGMEDAIVNACMTGKLSFTDMVNSMIADLMRLMVRQSITGPLANALGQGIGSLFGSGGNASSYSFGGSSGSWSGNFGIGNSLHLTPVSIGHDGWGLVGSSRPSNGYRMVPSGLFAGAPRFHGGTGFVKPGEYPAILKAGERVLNPAETRDYQSRRGEPTVNVNIVNSTGQPAETRTRSDNHGNKTIDVYVGDMAAKQMATPGTTLNRAVSAQTGTRRPAIKR